MPIENGEFTKDHFNWDLTGRGEKLWYESQATVAENEKLKAQIKKLEDDKKKLTEQFVSFVISTTTDKD